MEDIKKLVDDVRKSINEDLDMIRKLLTNREKAIDEYPKLKEQSERKKALIEKYGEKKFWDEVGKELHK